MKKQRSITYPHLLSEKQRDLIIEHFGSVYAIAKQIGANYYRMGKIMMGEQQVFGVTVRKLCKKMNMSVHAFEKLS